MPFEPKNVVRIIAERETFKTRGTGYPITKDRIITAGHVVNDVKEGEEVTLYWNGQEDREPFTATIVKNWFEEEMDIAVLAVQLPPKRQPDHLLMVNPPKEQFDWSSIGFSSFGDSYEIGSDESFGGHGDPFRDDKEQLNLTCERGKKTATSEVSRDKQWSGASGSPVFAGSRFLGVVTKAHTPSHINVDLVVVPLCWILRSRFSRDFRNAIGFDERRRNEHLECTVRSIADSLRQTKDRTLLSDFAKLLSIQVPKETNFEDYCDRTATSILANDKPLNVLSCLVKLDARTKGEHRDILSEVARHFLPFGYRPELIEYYRKRQHDNQTMLIESDSGAETIAEIITAGIQEKPIELAEGSLCGPAGFSLQGMQAPEEGPEAYAIDKNVRAWLRQMLAVKDRITGQESSQSLQAIANRLFGKLETETLRNDRVCYCLLNLSRSQQDREQEMRVINRIHELVNGEDDPVLFFVEILPEPSRDDARLCEYIQVLFPHTSKAK